MTTLARLTFLIAADEKRALEQLCRRQDLSVSQLLRRLIRDHMDAGGAALRESHDAAGRRER